MMRFNFDNSYAQLPNDFYAALKPTRVSAPQLIYYNAVLAEQLGVIGEPRAEIFSGNEIPEGAKPLAMAYAGHQFGHFVPQLGDGRAILLGEIVDSKQRRYDLQLKGSGPTPFSRSGDGRAALGPMLRELIVGEAMYALGIATTRTLAIVTTGDTVWRDEGALPGAIQTRVAASHIRIGTFEYFAARGQVEALHRLADYAITRHYPHLLIHEDRYLKFLEAVVEAQAKLISSWMHVGFIHGVMNTDNMLISGETIDYGPCAFLDDYDARKVYSSIDRYGRYAFGDQPAIAQWNLSRLAESLLPLIDKASANAIHKCEEILFSFGARYERYWLAGMRKKLGLSLEKPDDLNLASDLLAVMQNNRADYTNTFLDLARSLRGHELPHTFLPWSKRWLDRIKQEDQSLEQTLGTMTAHNAVYIPRNHRINEVIVAATTDKDYSKLNELMAALSQPYSENKMFQKYTLPPEPHEVVERTFCGT